MGQSHKTQFNTRTQTRIEMIAKFAISSLVALSAADKDSIDRQVLALVRNSSLRAFTGNIANAVNSLDEYGCWCYFYDNVAEVKVPRSVKSTDSAKPSVTDTNAPSSTPKLLVNLAFHGKSATTQEPVPVSTSETLATPQTTTTVPDMDAPSKVNSSTVFSLSSFPDPRSTTTPDTTTVLMPATTKVAQSNLESKVFLEKNLA